MKQIDGLRKYFPLYLTCLFAVVIMRILEFLAITTNYGFTTSLLTAELKGVIYDVVALNTILTVLYPAFYMLLRSKLIVANTLFILCLCLFSTAHILILKYYFYQLIPLDISIYKYSFKEIFFTISTSGVSIVKTLAVLFILLTTILLSFWVFQKIKYSQNLIKWSCLIITISIPVFITIQIFVQNNWDNNTKNKSFFFYTQSIKYIFLNDANTCIGAYSKNNAREFQQMYNTKSFLSTEYPLLHSLDSTNSLGDCFKNFDSSPNIVILIVEGLNDDFIHEYKGMNLMPFLSNLKGKSLYWERCFTLGERSFAVVPSILGGLPYGERGFTLQEMLPRHLSLVSILNANNYYTSFFYGQGSWFHKKDRFFISNNIDLIFDNNRFSKKYKKIVVGTDHFFWGYNDKDLFNQSLEVIDTIPNKKRLDVYFTGTSHPPYVITDENKYLLELEKMKTSENSNFIDTYKKYIKSVLFVDDALADIFHKYEKRADFDNTIFIITGDHPMTEIPRANSLKRYHVPLIIYSNKLKKSKIISNIVSHLDVMESLLSLLHPYLSNIPSVSTSLGYKLFVNKTENEKCFAFMNDNREIVDFYSNGYYKSGQTTFAVDSNLELKEIHDKKIIDKLSNELEIFKKTNLYVCLNNKIIDDDLYCKELKFEKILSRKSKDLSKTTSEYYNIISDVDIFNTDIIFDISFNYSCKSDKISLVYQLADSNGKVLFWKNVSISKKDNLLQVHLKIPKLLGSNSKLVFNSYFWNQDKSEFTFSNIETLIYHRKIQ